MTNGLIDEGKTRLLPGTEIPDGFVVKVQEIDMELNLDKVFDDVAEIKLGIVDTTKRKEV